MGFWGFGVLEGHIGPCDHVIEHGQPVRFRVPRAVHPLSGYRRIRAVNPAGVGRRREPIGKVPRRAIRLHALRVATRSCPTNRSPPAVAFRAGLLRQTARVSTTKRVGRLCAGACLAGARQNSRPHINPLWRRIGTFSRS